ncbi:MAG: hypothetical protein R2788_12035 [Saprospiraceae bacterium]
MKNIDNEEMYEEIRKGKYRIRVLKDKTGREVGRSCLEKIAAAAAVPLGGAAAAAATAVAATAAARHLLNRSQQRLPAPTTADQPLGIGKGRRGFAGMAACRFARFSSCLMVAEPEWLFWWCCTPSSENGRDCCNPTTNP